jgi:hypothetical protein
MTAPPPDPLPDPLPGRTRVTAAGGRRGTGASAATFAVPRDVEGEYVRSLIRAQLRLGIACALGFGLVLVAIPVAIALFPSLDVVAPGGVPVSWLLLGFGVYPIVIAVAALFVRAAARNEARYRSLAGDE